MRSELRPALNASQATYAAACADAVAAQTTHREKIITALAAAVEPRSYAAHLEISPESALGKTIDDFLREEDEAWRKASGHYSTCDRLVISISLPPGTLAAGR